MNYNSIKELLERFYAGETSLEEEAILKQFFAEGDVPEELRADQELFRSMTAFGEESLLDEDFDKAVLAQMEGSSFHWGRHEWIYTLSGFAAAAVIVISLWIGGVFSPQQQLPGTINNPKVAYIETRRVLAEVSDNLNKGIVPVRNAAEKLDQPMQQMSKIKDMEQALDKVKYLEQINKASEVMRTVNGVYTNLGIKITF
ncbi:MAG: hypothetical protein IH595_13760 [Bacteroidales bacterium]|nr:hypothetical protein [Bacteroidales bacterium]